MAENKISFLMYCNWEETFESLTDEEAGKLIKHFFRYVNYKDPVSDSRLINLIFEPMKAVLKNDLKKYEDKRLKNKENISKRWNKENTTVYDGISSYTNDTVIVLDKDKVLDKVLDKDKVLNQDIGDEIIIPEKTWKDDFEVYKENVRNGYREIMEDEAWFKKQSEFYPNVNILKSIEKSCVNFWITEAGWKNKKNAKTETINWKLTFANAISKPQNKVYYDRNTNIPTTGNTKSGNYSARNDAEERRRSVDNLADLARAILQEP